MRIRKNAKLSAIFGISSSPALQVCQLNQSPWDVIPFSHDSFSPSSSFHHHHQLEGEDSLARNTSFGDSIGHIDSGIETVMDGGDYGNTNRKQQEEAPDNYRNNGHNDNDMVRGCCKRTNGKGWQCSREAKEGHYLCDHHLKSQDNTNSNPQISGGFGSTKPAAASSAKKAELGRRGRPPKKGQSSNKAPSSEAININSNQQFYYYFGFGPSRRGRRAERGSCGRGREEMMIIEAADEDSSGEDEDDYAVTYEIEDEEEEEEDEEEGVNGGGGRRKKMRKPVKARSLKSLM